MFKQTKIKNNCVVFSRWSRKSYAVYASLRKIVIVAQLTIDVCKAALQKNQTVIQLLNLFNDENAHTNEFEINEFDEDVHLQLIPVLVQSREPLQNHLQKNLYNPYFVFQGMGFFVSDKTKEKKYLFN